MKTDDRGFLALQQAEVVWAGENFTLHCPPWSVFASLLVLPWTQGPEQTYLAPPGTLLSSSKPGVPHTKRTHPNNQLSYQAPFSIHISQLSPNIGLLQALQLTSKEPVNLINLALSTTVYWMLRDSPFCHTQLNWILKAVTTILWAWSTVTRPPMLFSANQIIFLKGPPELPLPPESCPSAAGEVISPTLMDLQCFEIPLGGPPCTFCLA